MYIKLTGLLGVTAGLALVAGAVSVPYGNATASGSSRYSVTRHAPSVLGGNPQGNIPTILGSLGSKRYPSLYGGVVEVDNGTHLDVYLTALDPAVEAAFTKCPGCRPRVPGDFTFVKTRHSLRYLDALHQRVTVASHRLMLLGVRLTEWWPQIQSAREMIGVRGLTRGEAALLRRVFDARNVQVFNVPPGQMPVPTSGRSDDSSPWKGGDFISDYVNGCTSSFAVKISGADQLLTAAHCFPTGQHLGIFNYNLISGTGSGRLLGMVDIRETASGSVDAEAIKTTSAGEAWTGNPASTTRLNINGAATNTVGGRVYNDGAYSGETTTLSIAATNECIVLTGFRKVCDIVHAYSSSIGVIANQEGDSGGPVLAPTASGKTYAAGIDSASTEGDTAPCQYNKPDKCFSDIFYVDMNSVLKALKASLIDG